MQTNFRGAFAGLVRGIPVTLALIAANVAVWALMTLIDDPGPDANGQAALLTRWGANIAGLTFAGEPWRLFTSMFLHAGGAHLAFNGLALLEIGGVVERRIGGWRLLAIYLAAGLGGACASASWHGFTVSVGASGAIFGLLAAVIAFGYLSRERLRGPYGEPVSAGRALLFGALTLVLGALFEFDNAAHLGGFATGALLAIVLLLVERAGPATRAGAVFIGVWLTMVAGIAAYVAGAFDPAAAVRLRFAQSIELVRGGNAGAQAATLRRCALVAAARQASTPADAFARCLGAAISHGGTGPSANDVTNRYAGLLQHNRLRVWPQCRQRTDQLLALALSAVQREIASTIGGYCAARARLEASVMQDVGGAGTEATSLQEDVLHLELISALADSSTSLPPLEGEHRAELQRQAAAFAGWKASLTRDDTALAQLSDCPFALCRRGGAR